MIVNRENALYKLISSTECIINHSFNLYFLFINTHCIAILFYFTVCHPRNDIPKGVLLVQWTLVRVGWGASGSLDILSKLPTPGGSSRQQNKLYLFQSWFESLEHWVYLLKYQQLVTKTLLIDLFSWTQYSKVSKQWILYYLRCQ